MHPLTHFHSQVCGLIYSTKIQKTLVNAMNIGKWKNVWKLYNVNVLVLLDLSLQLWNLNTTQN